MKNYAKHVEIKKINGALSCKPIKMRAIVIGLKKNELKWPTFLLFVC